MDLLNTLIERLEVRLTYAERFEAKSRKENNTEREAYWSARAEAFRDALAEARDIQTTASGNAQGKEMLQKTTPSKKEQRRIKVRIHHVYEEPLPGGGMRFYALASAEDLKPKDQLNGPHSFGGMLRPHAAHKGYDAEGVSVQVEAMDDKMKVYIDARPRGDVHKN